MRVPAQGGGDDPALRARLVEGGRVTAARYTRAQFDSSVIGAPEARLHRAWT
jgi:hypothetical protein